MSRYKYYGIRVCKLLSRRLREDTDLFSQSHTRVSGVWAQGAWFLILAGTGELAPLGVDPTSGVGKRGE